MAEESKQPKKFKLGPLTLRWDFGREHVAEVDRGGWEYTEAITTTALSGNGVDGARNRQLIYQKYQQMAADPIVSSAIRLHVTAALGGHETSGDVVFIEPTAESKGNTQAEQIVSELTKELAPIFNRIAFQVAYNGCIYGDAYGRIFAKKGAGIVGVGVDEMLLPPLVIPYEQGDKTVVCAVAIGPKLREKLVMDQIARLKMPRLIYTPQPLAIEKAWRAAVLENDPEKLPLMPSLVGGSFLADAEGQYDKFAAALLGLVGQRVLDSIDESIITANVAGMTKEQRQTFMNSIAKVLTTSKKVAEDATKNGKPFLGRIRHLIPVWAEKQLLGMQGVNSGGGTGTGRAGNISVDDVLFHAKLLAGSLGIDLSMLGFADLMSGGLGEGGFFRTSAQSAERARVIRWALTDFFNHLIDVHLIHKTGRTFEPANRPWQVNFYGTISALETERQKTRLDAVNAGILMAQCFQMVKDSGLDEAAMAHLFEREMKLDAEDAKMYAAAIAKAKKEAEAKEAAANGFGGGGGGGPAGLPFGGAGGGGDEGDEPPPGAAKPVKLSSSGGA